MKEKPELFPRHDGFGGAANTGNMDEFLAYHDIHRERLASEAARHRRAAKDMLASLTAQGTLPLTNVEWLSWLSENNVEWKKQLKESYQQRRQISHRLKPAEDFLQSSRGCARLLPLSQRDLVTSWAKKLTQQKHGYFCLKCGRNKRVFFFCGLLGKGYAMDLQCLAPLQYELDLSPPLRAKMVPYLSLTSEWPPHDDVDVEVYQLSVEQGSLIKSGHLLRFHVSATSLIVLRPRKRRADTEADADADLYDPDNCDFTQWCDKEDLDVQSDAEELAEQEVEELQEIGAEVPVEDVLNAPEGEPILGSNVVQEYCSGYFTLEDYFKRGRGHDCKMRLRPRWHGDGADSLGRTDLSKTLSILKFDSNPAEPTLTYLCLRSWSLHRVSKGEWLNQCRERRQWYHSEVDSLKQAVARLRQPPGTTGCLSADELIRAWSPQVLEG